MNNAALAEARLKLPIVTRRLVIRDFLQTDIPKVTKIVSHSQFPGYRQFRPAHIAADVKHYIEKAIDAQKQELAGGRRELFRLAICLRSDQQQLIGCCVFDGWNLLPKDNDQIGYFIHPAHHGHGYAVEAMQPLLAAYFSQYPEGTVYAIVHPSNKASQRVLEKLTFSKCGTENIQVDNAQQPRRVYSASAQSFGQS